MVKELCQGTMNNKNIISSILLIISLFIISSGTAFSYDDDEKKHFGFSTVFGFGSETSLYYMTELKTPARILLATTIGSMPGLAKELMDSTEDNNSFSEDDMKADIAGAFTGALVSTFFNCALHFEFSNGHEKKVGVEISFDY